MIAEVCEGVVSKFSGSVLDTALASRLYFQQAPQESEFPYGVFFIVTTDSESFLGVTATTNRILHMTIQLSLFSNATDGGSQIATLFEKAVNVFDWCELSMDGYYSIKCERVGGSGIIYTDEIWQSTMDYEIWYMKE